MDMASVEALDLKRLEEESNNARTKDARIKVVLLIFKLVFLGLVAIGMPLVAWPIISNLDPVEATNHGFGILMAVLLADEGHKALLYIEFVNEKKIDRDRAQAAIDTFLGLDDDKEQAMDENDSIMKHEDSSTTKQSDSIMKEGDSIMKDTTEEESSRKRIAMTFDLELGSKEKPVKNKKELIRRRSSCHSVVEEDIYYRVLAVEDLDVVYPDRGDPVFLHHYQSFQRGTTHALIGESGCGKSTLLKVLAGLLKPTSGRTRMWKDARLAFVGQDQKFFARSVRENVSYGSTVEVTDQQVWDALEWANIRPWVDTLPNGIHQVLDGAENDISGGQLQRLLLAQLYCTCKDADIILLDEVLSAVDLKSRQVLVDRLGEFLCGKTALVVTHNTEMLRICSQTHEMTKCLAKYRRSVSPLDSSTTSSALDSSTEHFS